MSVQEERLTAIADAIRAKDGTTAPIPARDFAARILALPASGGFAVPLLVTADEGAVITAANGASTVTAIAGADQRAALTLDQSGLWTVEAQLGEVKRGPEMIEVVGGYEAAFSFQESRLPKGYTEVEYLHWDGLNTAFVLLENVVCSTDRLFYRFCPEESGGGADRYMLFINSTVSAKTYSISLSAYAGATLQYTLNTTVTSSLRSIVYLDTILELDADFLNGSYTLNGTAMTGTANTNSLGTTNRVIGSAPSSRTVYSAVGKFYQLTHYRNGEVIHDYVPCINPSGVAGVFDLNTETFIQNTKTGATGVTPGPAV